MTKLDILVINAHPDDAELGCAGTLLTHKNKGYTTGIIDLTRGELGTRGSKEIRLNEAENSSKILGLSIRENLNLPDGHFNDDKQECLEVIKAIRKYQPEIILTNAPADRHPDHGMAARLVARAGFLSGLIKIETYDNDLLQPPWRAKQIFNFIQDTLLIPDFVVDISDVWETKIESVKAFQSQFFLPGNEEPRTYIANPEFLHFIESRAREFGHSIGVKYGEGFIKSKQLGVQNMFDIL